MDPDVVVVPVLDAAEPPAAPPKSCTKAAKLFGLDRALRRLELYCQ